MSAIQSNQKIMPFLWFDGQAEEAMNLYTTIFPNSKVNFVRRWPEGGPFPAGTIMAASIVINGLTVNLFDAGPMFKFNESVSFFVLCETQEEIDRYWERLCEGGQESQCGWLKDKFGFSWQIVPTVLNEKLQHGDPVRYQQMMQALMGMRKLDIAELEAAYNR